MVESSSVAALAFEQIPLALIYTSPHQMRRHFDSEALKDLAASMKHEGLIQPITVRKVGDAFELIVGERRLRAAKMLGWEKIDARILEINDEDAAVKGLIENLQRADLSPIEEARGYKQLLDPPYNLTQDAVSKRVGKSPAAVARGLALLDLPQEIQDLIPKGVITETHTRALRKLPARKDQIGFALKAHKLGWSAKELEREVLQALAESGEPIRKRDSKPEAADSDPLERMWKPLMDAVEKSGVKVRGIKYQGKGRWSLDVQADQAPNLRRAMADFFIRLGHTLNGPSR